MTSEFYYEPSESVYQHYAWANNGKVSLCNDSDGEYEQVFGNREEFQHFVNHLMAVANEAWPGNGYKHVVPQELVEQWVEEANEYVEQEEYVFADLAAQWGADQELAACCEWLDKQHEKLGWAYRMRGQNLHNARR